MSIDKYAIIFYVLATCYCLPHTTPNLAPKPKMKTITLTMWRLHLKCVQMFVPMNVINECVVRERVLCPNTSKIQAKFSIFFLSQWITIFHFELNAFANVNRGVIIVVAVAAAFLPVRKLNETTTHARSISFLYLMLQSFVTKIH